MTKPNLPPESPWSYEAKDIFGRTIRITVTFDNDTRELLNAQLFRDVDCLYRRLYIGTGDDGKPDSSARKFIVQEGTRNLDANQLQAFGLTVIEDILSRQITAGP